MRLVGMVVLEREECVRRGKMLCTMTILIDQMKKEDRMSCLQVLDAGDPSEGQLLRRVGNA
jgi:hypothetical protein